jgi:ankyrin repeat protein
MAVYVGYSTRKHEAQVSNWLAIIKFLIEQNCDLEVQQEKTGRTALLFAVCFKFTKGAELLLDAGAKLEVPDATGWTPLLWAALGESTETLQLMLSRKANVNAVSKDGWTLMTIAASLFPREDKFKILLPLKLDLNKPGGPKNQTPLELVLKQRFPDMALVVKLLIDAGAKPEARDESGKVVVVPVQKLLNRYKLSKSLGNLDFQAFKATLEAEPALLVEEIFVENVLESRPLLLAVLVAEGRNNASLAPDKLKPIRTFELEALKHLLDKKADPNITMRGGITPLQLAAFGGFMDAARLLVSAGANVNANSREGPALFAAMQGNHAEMVEYLLQQKSKTTFQGLTALGLAVKKGKPEIVRVLLNNKLDPNEPSEPGKMMPLQLIKQSKGTSEQQEEISKLLRAAGAK